MDNRTLFGPTTPNGRLKHRVDSMTAMQSMARAGLGVALPPCYIADCDPTLRRAMPEPMLDNRFDIWILYHPDIRRVYRVRLFTDFVVDLIKSDLDLFEDRRPI